jgi:hypothetical protein
MAGTELPLLGAAIKYYGQATPQISFRNVGAGKLQPVIPTLQQLRNLWLVWSSFSQPNKRSGFCPIIPRPAQQFIVELPFLGQATHCGFFTTVTSTARVVIYSFTGT